MISLKNFTIAEAPILRLRMYSDMSIEQIEALICEWQRKEFNGKYFEMYAIWHDKTVVGAISLYQHSKEVISMGPEIFPAHQRKGFAKQAMRLACDIAKEKGYKIVSQQIRINNEPSIALHKSLGFETNDLIYTNAKCNQVSIYLKSLV